MSIDLTRFDFHALRFTKSLDVMSMSAEEVGCYILLLCESWLIGDNCTLPDNPEILARLGRVSQISDKVLKKFPLEETEWGPRRRNPVLYAEWMEAMKRSLDGKRAVESRKDRVAAVIQSYNDRITTVLPTMLPKPSQAKSIQTNPNQGSGDFHNIAIKYRTAMGKGHSKAKTIRVKYAEVCSRFGEDAVLSAFEEWAESNKWRAENLGNSGLRFFFSDLPEMIEEISEIKNQSEKKYEQQQKEIEVAFATAQPTETEKLLRVQDAEREREKQAIVELEKNPYAF